MTSYLQTMTETLQPLVSQEIWSAIAARLETLAQSDLKAVGAVTDLKALPEPTLAWLVLAPLWTPRLALKTGFPLPPDARDAATFFERACQQGYAEAEPVAALDPLDRQYWV